MRASTASFAIALSLLPCLALGWEDHGHELVNRAAAKALPAEVPVFFRNAVERLTYLGPEPDRWKNDRDTKEDDNFDQLFAWGFVDHFLDIEYTEGIEWAKALKPGVPRSSPRASRYNYLEALKANLRKLESEKRFREFKADGLAPESVGFLPFRIVELAQQLKRHWIEWRKPNIEPTTKQQIEQNIVYVAGILGHYVADGANPHHTTVHYNGWDEALEANPGGFTPKGKSAHHRFEGEFVDARIASAEITEIEKAVAATSPKPIDDLFDVTMAFLRESNSQVRRLYELDKSSPWNKGNTSPESLGFAQQRLTRGATMLRDLWVWALSK